MAEIELANLKIGTLYRFVGHNFPTPVYEEPDLGWAITTSDFQNDIGSIQPGEMLVFLGLINHNDDRGFVEYLVGNFISQYGFGTMRRVTFKEIHRELYFEEVSAL